MIPFENTMIRPKLYTIINIHTVRQNNYGFLTSSRGNYLAQHQRVCGQQKCSLRTEDVIELWEAK